MRNLPPMNSLKVFEAAARLKSFSKASSELGVTQGAISKQMKGLEEFLGLKLFRRKHQSIVLTEEAETYLESVRKALEIMEQATDKLRNHSVEETISMNVLPSLSSRWLIPKLDDFKKRHPHISVNINTGDGDIDFDASGADIAIRASQNPEWKQLYYEKIMGEELLPVCSPKFEIKSPGDLVNYQLLQHTTRKNMWFDYMKGIGYEHIKVQHNIGFEHFFMLVQAVIDGLGVALIPKFLIEEELKKGQMVVPFKTKFKSPFCMYFLCPKHKMELRKVKKFRDWLIGIAAKS